MEDTAIDYQKLYEESLLTISKKEEELANERQKILQLNFELDKFRKYLFGRKSEKLPIVHIDTSQMDLFGLGTTQQQQEELSEKVASVKKERKKRNADQGRMALPETLRRETVTLEPSEDLTGCVKIGEEVTEVLELIPAEFYVKRYVRPKYARPQGAGIVIAQLPERVIAKGIPSDSVVAQMTVDKYVYALPLHRQIDKYRRMGVNIPASTASDWLLKGWKHLVPLWELLKLLIINQKYLQVDESPIKVLDRDHKNGVCQGYMWVYNAPADGLVLFDYRKGRDRSGPEQMLKTYQGILQTDGYTVYEQLFGNHPHILLVYCMAHARRKFVDAIKYDQEKANKVLGMIKILYDLEADMRAAGLSWEERTRLRQEKAVPELDKIKAWLDEQAPVVLPKSPLGQAIGYTLPRWEGLSAYARHGQIEIDNNLAENAIRPLAIGRKNYLFAGSHDAAEMTAAMYSFMATCKKNGVDEFEWLRDVFQRIESYKHKDLYQLLPNNWAKHRT